jgi:hypothetical protein
VPLNSLEHKFTGPNYAGSPVPGADLFKKFGDYAWLAALALLIAVSISFAALESLGVPIE